ncbi:MAG: hypothetical protein P1U53_16520 [Sulfitobacter sp.]|nr:hypothetical protein [Sulfitobacter sp.]
MKLILTTTAAALIGTLAIADESTRYNDLRLDTSNTAERSYSDGVTPTDLDAAQRGRDQLMTTTNGAATPDVTLSTRSEVRTSGEGYIYGGFGDNNDSR